MNNVGFFLRIVKATDIALLSNKRRQEFKDRVQEIARAIFLELGLTPNQEGIDLEMLAPHQEHLLGINPAKLSRDLEHWLGAVL